MPRKDPTPATLKALFAKCGNCCAFSKCSNGLVDDLNIFVGEVCHIHAVSQKDARYDATKSNDQLRHFDNLMLMCHPHHKRVDTREDLYPADTLRAMKAEHEAMYEQDQFAVDDSVLAQAALQIVQDDWAPYLDSAVELLYDTLQEGHVSQSKMNQVSANVAEIMDAQLFVVYTRLLQRMTCCSHSLGLTAVAAMSLAARQLHLLATLRLTCCLFAIHALAPSRVVPGERPRSCVSLGIYERGANFSP